jgi:hypothetical protein
VKSLSALLNVSEKLFGSRKLKHAMKARQSVSGRSLQQGKQVIR